MAMMARERERKARRREVSVAMTWNGELRGRMLVWEAILTIEWGSEGEFGDAWWRVFV